MGELRDRIAAVLANSHLNGRTTFFELADAVIAELGLRAEFAMTTDGEPQAVSKDEYEYRTWYGEPWTFRYVTDWKDDDE